MGSSVLLRTDFDATRLRFLARKCGDNRQIRHPQRHGSRRLCLYCADHDHRGPQPHPRPVVQATVAVQRYARSHKMNVRLRAHWGCHDLTALMLLQQQTAPDGPAIEPKRNYPRMILRH
jgi:hypothetical protein